MKKLLVIAGALASLTAGNVAATDGLARLIGEKEFSILFHEGERDNIHIWMGECHVHAGINGAELADLVHTEPEAELFIHPECGCATSALYLASSGVVPKERTRILSTGGMLEAARTAVAIASGKSGN